MVAEIKINSEQFHNVTFSASQILAWLQVIRDISGEDQLEMALKRCALRVLDEEQSNALVMVRALIVHEASGNITPTTKLFETYRNITTNAGGLEIVERRGGADRRAAVA